MTNISYYLQKHKQEHPKKIFLKTKNSCLTFEETSDKVEKISSIINQFLEKSVISIMFDNCIEFVISYLAIIQSGCIAHIISPSISKTNFSKQIKSSNPKIILTLNKFKKEFENIEEKIQLIDFYEFEKQDSISKTNQVSNIASLLYTSGTTSAPKGVPIKNSNIIFTTKNISNILEYHNSDIDVMPLSLSHSFGLGCLHTSLYVGSTFVLHKNSMNVLEIFDSIKENKATTFAAVPATLTSIVNDFPEEFAEKCKELRLIITNSTKISKETVQKILDLLPNTKLATYYGLTEASRSTFMIFNDTKYKEESVGKPAPGVEIKIVKDKDDSKSGEIWVKGENVIENYWNHEFLEKFSDRWLKTGDLGYFDNDEFLYLTGRIDDIINIGGEKVNPIEIENVVKMMDTVDDAIAVSIEHQLFGHTIKLLVKTLENKAIEPSSIIMHCKKNLERYKIPTEIEFVPDFPRNEHGKIIRFMIKGNNHGSN